MALLKSLVFVGCAMLSLLIVGISASAAISSDAAATGASVNLLKNAPFGIGGGIPASPGRFGCPLCDASVYSYCSNRAVHDGCCCNGGRPPIGYGYPCPQAINCQYLHANSCYEHQLILNCCCNRP